ncbi:MAG: hypothetical protein C4522_03495 [Desulfobacteraceae bacterium]|nr:MAG: hypothetical protein C4522_03495 [Desulfobacteraceae bacterium]
MRYFHEKSLFLWILFVFITSLVFSGPSAAYETPVFPIHEKALERETEHFRFIYQEPLEETVPLIAAYFEEAYAVLTPIFNWQPSGKTTVLLQDGFDTHNGWSTTVPQNVMSLYIAGPTPVTSIFQDGNYMKRTIYHELTHLISMDMRLGYSKYFSRVFGKVEPTDVVSMGLFLFTSSPVQLAPRWFLEGMSIWSETEFCPPGRGRSTYADMLFRLAVRDDQLLPYSKWYLEIPYWPYGDAAYLYGMKYFQYLYENSPRKNVVGDEVQGLAKSFLFNLDSPNHTITGKYAWEMAGEMLAHEEQAQKDKLERLHAYTPTENKRLTAEEISVFHPVFAGNRIFFLGMEPEDRDTLYAYDPATRETEKMSCARSTSVYGSLSASSDGRYLYYTVLELMKNENFWSEVRRYDVREGRDKRVTDQGRYVSVDLSPDGTKLAAVSQRSGKSYLVTTDLDADGHAGEERILTGTPLFHVLSAPKFSQDGKRITYAETSPEGYFLKVYDLPGNRATTVYQGRNQILTPDWHPAKDNLLVFSSDLNGVYNLYAIEAEHDSVPVALTHVTGGLFSPNVSADGGQIAAVGFDAKGPYLTMIPYPVIGFAVSALPAIGPSWEGGKAKTLLAKEIPEITTAAEKSVSGGTSESYNSFAGIRPDYWSPWLDVDAFGLRTGAGVSFSDPTGYQSLKISAGYTFEYDAVLGALHYTYSGIYPLIHIYAAADQEHYPDLLVDQRTGFHYDYTEDMYGAGAALEFPYAKVDRQILFRCGYEFSKREVVEETEWEYRYRRLSVFPTGEDSGEMWARIIYFDGTAFNSSSSVEDGRYISLAASVSDEALGGGYFRKLFTSEWREYLPMPWLSNHVLLVSGFYGYGDGDPYAQGYFGLGGSPGASLFAGDSFGISRTVGIRGYSGNDQVGEKITRAIASYRFPIVNFSKGFGNRFPSYFQQIHGEVYYEGGRTWDEIGRGDELEWLNAAGTEVNLSMTLLRYLQFAPGLGVVYAPDQRLEDEEENEVTAYISVKGWVSF